MINRSLIRIKTVQILYSHLLTRNDFKLAAPPAPTDSPDAQMAHTIYLDLLGVLMKLSGKQPAPGFSGTDDPVFKKNRVGSMLQENPEVRKLLGSHNAQISVVDPILDDLRQAIAESTAYTAYKRRRKLTLADDVAFWNTVMSTTVRRHKGLERTLRRDGRFSHVAFDKAVALLGETLNSFDDSRSTYLKAKSDLEISLRQAFNLYHALLWLPVLITDLQEYKLDAARHKYLPTADDLNPNMRLVANKYVAIVRDSEAMAQYLKDYPDANPANWRNSDILVSRLLESILASELYAKYKESETHSFEADAEFWREVTRTIIIPSDELAEALEDKSVFWNDDLDTMGTYALKTIRRTYADAEGNPVDKNALSLLPMFMDAEDERFGAELFEFVVQNRQQYRSYIDRFINTEQWDTERLATMDIVVMLTAIAEIINYPSIPVPVTMNEYIQIASDYSTPRSGQFVNGILYNVVKLLNEEGVVAK